MRSYNTLDSVGGARFPLPVEELSRICISIQSSVLPRSFSCFNNLSLPVALAPPFDPLPDRSTSLPMRSQLVPLAPSFEIDKLADTLPARPTGSTFRDRQACRYAPSSSHPRRYFLCCLTISRSGRLREHERSQRPPA